MSSERVPTRSEVMGWGPHQLSDYLRKMNLSGCDKVVLKNNISGSRFINLSDHDLQKFPKLHAPLISKISAEISKKDERKGLFGRKVTPKYQEPDVSAEPQGWDEDEFDEEEFDNDYESPYSGDDAESVEDYELPNDDAANDYEPPPSQPPEDLKVCPSLPIGDDDYIDNRNSHAASRGPPPVVTPRPSASTVSGPSARMLGDSSRRDHSPLASAGRFPPEPPQISRENKPGRHVRSTPSPIRGAHQNTADRPSTHSWKNQPDSHDVPAWSKPPALPPSSASVTRSNTFAKHPPNNKFDVKREQQPLDDGLKRNTFPLHHKKPPPCPGALGPPSHQGDSLHLNFPAAGSLPLKLQSAIAEQRSSFRGPPLDRHSFNSPPTSKPIQTRTDTQELDPRWYVGQVSRGQAEGCLKQVRKDGAYLVRDSVRQLDGQPFTLMVYYQEKVYNIQIRQQNQRFLLGTGLKVQEPFPSVRDIIYHYSQFPLLLIDAKKRSLNQQNQCLLSDPAGCFMTGQSWT